MRSPGFALYVHEMADDAEAGDAENMAAEMKSVAYINLVKLFSYLNIYFQ